MPSPTFQPVSFAIGARISATWQSGLATGEHLMYFRSENEDPLLSEVEDMNTLVGGWVATVYKEIFNAGWKVFRVETFSAFNEFGAYKDGAAAINGDLVNVDPQLDPSHAPLALLGTGLRGRSHHGRFFALSPAQGEMQGFGQGYTATHLGNLVVRVETLMGAATTAGHPMVVASKLLNEINDVTSVTASQRLTMQTRRRVNFGS